MQNQGPPNVVTRSQQLPYQGQPTISYPRLQTENEINNSKLQSEAPITRRPLSPRGVSEDLDIAARTKDELIQDCKANFRDQQFVVICDGHSETVESHECNKFFSRFERTNWLADSNLMPLMFSFDWPSISTPTTLQARISDAAITAAEASLYARLCAAFPSVNSVAQMSSIL